jgi:glucosyl-dolichyl phosphate glucuronosyltransferase
MAAFLITIAVCTWNRSESLSATLSSLQQLTIPSDINWELLIVNNDCTDDTDAVIERFADALPIRLLHEKRPGLSNARNCAIAAAKGDYILWTDDDAILDPNWLVAYINAFRTWPNAALFGGPIKLKLEGNPPAWFPELLCDESFAAVYARRDLSNMPVKLNSKKWTSIPYGVNLCVRMREQRDFLYNPNLGRRKNRQIRGEETAVVEAIIDSGAEGWWVPGAIVHHVITEDLQTQAHLRRYFMGLGRTYVRAGPQDPNRTQACSFRALRLLLSALKWELRFQVNRLWSRPKIWFEDLRSASLRWGELSEFLKFSSEI